MIEEAKTSGHKHADDVVVSKFDQSKDNIPKVVPPRGSKDSRSFRPSTLAEVNVMSNYQPLELKCGKMTVPIGCGNSLEDLLLISACLLCLWCFILGVFGLFLKGAIDSTDSHTVLWAYFWIFISFVAFTGGMIATGQVERRRAEKKAADEAAEEAAAGLLV
ncbi:unnamed protein product [Discosporangium mesarthrocarpum]